MRPFLRGESTLGPFFDIFLHYLYVDISCNTFLDHIVVFVSWRAIFCHQSSTRIFFGSSTIPGLAPGNGALLAWKTSIYFDSSSGIFFHNYFLCSKIALIPTYRRSSFSRLVSTLELSAFPCGMGSFWTDIFIFNIFCGPNLKKWRPSAYWWRNFHSFEMSLDFVRQKLREESHRE